MNNVVVKLLQAYLKLNEDDQRELVKYMRQLDSSGVMEKRALTESLNKSLSNTINFSPAPGGCPVCGK